MSTRLQNISLKIQYSLKSRWHISAGNKSQDVGNSTILTEGTYGIGIHVKYLSVANIDSVEENIALRPYTGVPPLRVYRNGI